MLYDVTIIGCGVIGASIAYELSKYKLNLLILEADNDVANGTTKANSGIIHSGYDPKPGTLMAKLNVEGNFLAKELCKDLDVPFCQNGSLVLAFNDSELKHLQKLYERGVANKVPDIKILTGDEVKELEPELSSKVVGALYTPSAGIINPWEYAIALSENAVKGGAILKLCSAVTGISKKEDFFTLHTKTGDYQSKYIVNAAGLNASTIQSMVCKVNYKNMPSRGQYYLLDKSEGTRVKHTIFQCPNENGKGILVAPTVHGNLIVGPDAKDSEIDDVATDTDGLKFIATMGKKSVPNVDLRACIRNFSGVRANTDSSDFIIEALPEVKRFINVAGIKSPGLSAAPAIAKYVVDLLKGNGLELTNNKNFVKTRKQIRFKELSIEEKAEVITKKPEYGRVICRCETITEGEILDAIRSPITPISIDAIKRRCNAGMGRCQGGFCSPRVLELLSKELNLKPTEILQDKDGTFILIDETKNGGAQNV